MVHGSVAAMLAVAAPFAFAQSDVVPTSLTCEYLRAPLGIDTPAPRLSWVLEPTQEGLRALRQTAYRIIVATTPKKLADDRGDLWDTGKVMSDQSVHLVYSGAPLQSHQECYWKVRVWDQQDHPSVWSHTTRWSMGILKPDQWQAQWITYREPLDRSALGEDLAPPVTLEGCRWIWLPGTKLGEDAPAGARYFRRAFELPPDAKVEMALGLITVDDQFTLFINGKQAGQSDGAGYAWRRPQRIELTEHLRPGRNVIAIEATNSSPSPAGVLGALLINLSNGRQEHVRTDKSWLTSPQKARGWQELTFDDSGWAPATELGAMGVAPWHAIHTDRTFDWRQDAPSPLLRKTFTVDQSVRRATLYACGLGLCETRINGQKITDSVLDPVFTDYTKSVLYTTHDATDRIRRGENVLGVMLGNGWYNCHARDAWDFDRAPWRDRPKLLLHLRIELANEDVQTVTSDATWRAANGPLLFDGMRHGEYYDARREMPGWDRPGFDDSHWRAAQPADPPAGRLTAQMMPPVKIMAELAPTAINQPKPGVYLFDFGQNTAGWARLSVKGPAGTRVVMKYGERLSQDGTLQQRQIAGLVHEGPFQTDVYVLKGVGRQDYEPRFTYHGFRYVQVTGLPTPPGYHTLTARVAHTAFTPAGSFRCSNGLLNTIQRLTLWAYRSNYLGYPTDCPHREKNGWTGDAHLAAEAGLLNYHNAASYAKWMNDFADAQRDNGDLPGIVPTSGWGYGTGPAWDSAYILIPWYMYLYRGDTRVLADHYAQMKRYVDYLGTRQKDHIVDYGLGDWVPADTVTPRAVTSTAYYYVDTLILSRAARLLGRTDDAAAYERKAADIREAFNRTFYKGDGLYANGSQTALSCALYQGLTRQEDEPEVLRRLVDNVREHDWHLDTGILGAKYLLQTLTDHGRADAAYRIATQDTFPSYGDWIMRGATTLWEDWRGGASLNHIMFGDVSAWFYRALAGINAEPQYPGFKHIIIRPHPVDDLSWARAEHDSPYGTIRSAWRKREGTLSLHVDIPVNTTATVYMPCTDPGQLRESGRPIGCLPGVTLLRLERDCGVLEVGSGSYRFVSR